MNYSQLYRPLSAEEICNHQYSLKTNGITYIDDFILPCVIKEVLNSMKNIRWHTYANRYNRPEIYDISTKTVDELKQIKDDCLSSGTLIPYYYLRSVEQHPFITALESVDNLEQISKILDSPVLSAHGFHFSKYQEGDFLSWHSDLEKKRSYAVVYNFTEWYPGNGGELEVINNSGNYNIIPPICGRVSIFKIDNGTGRRHQVRRQNKGTRYTCAGWYTCPGINE